MRDNQRPASGPANQMPEDASVVMVKTRDSDGTMNFVAKREDALSFQRQVFAKRPTPSADEGVLLTLGTEFEEEPCSLETYPTPDGRRTTVTVRRGDVTLLCVDRHTGILPVSGAGLSH